ncbi:phage portal protein [Natribacillus halophilus]|uniref:Phage portal protein, SPP1 family n=1 Tax=Natribacillus halophilus TaxID=549003 RepID=A0A1G8RSY7_9BACI|nr:phage portal protein [Natribacillus halophilus]SDJ20043.1 phage portal protein, SPP1 family [Natribacillus halophilus]
MATITKHKGRRFPKSANDHYRYESAESLLENMRDLQDMIQHHMAYQRPRLDELDDYYLGDNTMILNDRERHQAEDHKADYRATHNYAKYVSQFIVGYLAGNPITIQHEDERTQEAITEVNHINDVDAVNSELVLDLSIYGRAYELLYRSSRDENKFALSSPLQTFVIYDDTVEQLPIAAVRYHKNEMLQNDPMKVDVYTDSEIIRYQSESNAVIALYEVEREPHFFGGIPINEYENNRFRQGDYENVLNLIDLYDAAQSDTANYMSDLNDAMLLIKGNLDMSNEDTAEMKKSNILFLRTEPDADGRESSADANYIYKEYDVQGSEAYKTRLLEDIHKFTNTPNMQDESFGGTQSGESMKYKLFGLEQVRAIKERLFKRSLTNRYRLLSNIMNVSSELSGGNMDALTIQFTPNLPRSMKDEVEVFSNLGGQLSEETMLSLLSFVEEPQEEIERLNAERTGQMNPNRDYIGNQQGGEEGEEDGNQS